MGAQSCGRCKEVIAIWRWLLLQVLLYLENFKITTFNTVLKRLVVWIRSSLLLKIQWLKHHYLSEHGCYSVREF